MDKEDHIKGFFIEDERKFKKEDILSLINRVKIYAKLVGREGKVHIINKSLSGTDMSKIFLVTRYLGGELSKVKPELKINKNIPAVNVQEFADFLSKDKHNARARMSTLCSGGFAKRKARGSIMVEPFQIESFLDQLEKPPEKPKEKITRPRTTRQKRIEKEIIEIDENKIFEKLSSDINVEKIKLNDVLFIKQDGTFKFNTMIGDSKYAKQKNCIICSGYILLMGFNIKNFKTRQISEICFHSNIDTSDLAQSIKILKKQELITKTGRHSQENKMREKGKTEARRILKELCS